MIKQKALEALSRFGKTVFLILIVMFAWVVLGLISDKIKQPRSKEAKEILAEYDDKVFMAMKGVGDGSVMTPGECEKLLRDARNSLKKRLMQLEEEYQMPLGKWMPGAHSYMGKMVNQLPCHARYLPPRDLPLFEGEYEFNPETGDLTRVK